MPKRTEVNRFFTLLVVPHDGKGQMRRVRIRKMLVYSASLFFGIATLFGALFPVYFLRASARDQEAADLREENRALRSAQDQFDQRLTEVRRQVREFEAQARKFALMAGIEDLPEGDLAAGSSMVPGRGGIEAELDVLGRQAGQLLDNYERIGIAFEDQLTQLGSTPSVIPVKGILGHGYGWRKDPFTGLRDFHPGVDIVANRGTRVIAPADGIVTKSTRSGGYGKVVFLSHGSGVTTRFGHLDTTDVKVGDRVQRGDVIGRVGSTGRSTGPHLHYEVLVHNQKVNPLHYIIDEYRRF